MAKTLLKTSTGRFGALLGSVVVATTLWVGLGGPMRASAPPLDPITCLPTCATIDGRFLVVAGDDDTTLAAVEISVGLRFTVAAGPDGNFDLFDGDRDQANWDVPYSGGGAPPQLIVELFADPAGIGGAGPALHTWTPGAILPVALPALGEHGAFPTTNNAFNGVVFPHDGSALSGSNYRYAVHIRPANPAVDKGWNAFKIRAAGSVSLLGNQVVGFIGAMNLTLSDLTTIYPNWDGSASPASLTPTTYDGTWSFSTILPAFLGDVTVFDGDMDYGDELCAFNDTNDADSSGIPGFAAGGNAVAEGVAQATGLASAKYCDYVNAASGTRTGLPADDNASPIWRRLPTTIGGLGIAYKLVAPGGPKYPGGQTFINSNPSGNREWEQFKIELVAPGDFPLGRCPAGGYPANIPKSYAASDCRTDELPGGQWDIVLEGMDLSNLNFWFFGFKVVPLPVDYSIGRLVWYDANANGVQDLCAGIPCAPELGIPGVSYTVYDSAFPLVPVRTGVTDVNGEFLELLLPAANYTVVVDLTNFAPLGPLVGLTSTTGGETETGVEVGLPPCNPGNPVGCGEPPYAEAIFGYVAPGVCLAGPIGGINLGSITNYLFFFENGTKDANWQGASNGFVGNVLANGTAKERTAGFVPYAGTIYTSDTQLDAWQKIVDDNPGQAAVSTGNLALIGTQRASLLAAFTQINSLVVTPGYENRSATSLNNLDTTNGSPETLVINIRSGLAVSTKINITGDPGDVFILRWDTDANFANGYQGKVKFSGGGGIVPLGGLTAANFIHVAGVITSSGGGSTPAPPFPQGPRLDNGTGNLITGGSDFNGGGFFTGYWLTTGEASMSNGIFVGGWYTLAEKFNLTSGTSGVYVCPTNAASIR